MVCGVPALQSIDWHDGAYSIRSLITYISSLLLTRTHDIKSITVDDHFRAYAAE